MLFNKKVVVGEKGSPLKQSITLSNHIELQSNQNSFSFRIAAISYQSPSMNTLLYRLEGYDSEWHTAGKGPITYSNLPYGTYMLRVKGANSDGVWNPDVRTLGIQDIAPVLFIRMGIPDLYPIDTRYIFRPLLLFKEAYY